MWEREAPEHPAALLLLGKHQEKSPLGKGNAALVPEERMDLSVRSSRTFSWMPLTQARMGKAHRFQEFWDVIIYLGSQTGTQVCRDKTEKR